MNTLLRYFLPTNLNNKKYNFGNNWLSITNRQLSGVEQFWQRTNSLRKIRAKSLAHYWLPIFGTCALKPWLTSLHFKYLVPLIFGTSIIGNHSVLLPICVTSNIGPSNICYYQYLFLPIFVSSNIWYFQYLVLPIFGTSNSWYFQYFGRYVH